LIRVSHQEVKLTDKLAVNIRNWRPPFHMSSPLHCDQKDSHNGNQTKKETIGDKLWWNKTNIRYLVRLVPQNIVITISSQTVRPYPALLAFTNLSLSAPTTLCASTGITSFSVGSWIAGAKSACDSLERMQLFTKTSN
jgi:hypothetical protein